MSQLGMQMPGRARQSKPKINVYTGLALCSVAALGFAVVVMYMSATNIASRDGGIMGLFQVREAPTQAGNLDFTE